MSRADVREEIAVQLGCMLETLDALAPPIPELTERTPTALEKMAASAGLGDLYGGAENVMQRLCKHSGDPLPLGGAWHRQLLDMFSEGTAVRHPALFGPPLAERLREYQRFRHVAAHGYGVRLDWSRMEEAVFAAPDVFTRAMAAIQAYADALPPDPGECPPIPQD
jgi:hypothetical protein